MSVILKAQNLKAENLIELEAALHSEQFIAVRRRIFRQLLESMIYEGIIQPDSTVIAPGIEEFRVEGRDLTQKPVWYICYGKRKKSFNRIRLSKQPVLRIDGKCQIEANSLNTFLLEICSLLEVDVERLSTFVDEIEQTLLKDTIAQYRRHQLPHLTRDGSYDDLEADVMDAHPYHPCYKSRMGFDLVENVQFAPDFKPEFSLFWLAIHQENLSVSVSQHLDRDNFIQEEIGQPDYSIFIEKLKSIGCEPEYYQLLPVHPWQWRKQISSKFYQEIVDKKIIPLGEGTNKYRPQQSIRTLANQTFPHKAYVKLPLSITNTSTSRILAPHTVDNAAKISDWLASIYQRDTYLNSELRLILLKEFLGISYKNSHLSSREQQKVYGILGTIWRESIVNFLEPDQRAIPFNALCHIDIDEQPLIDPWVKRWGLKHWLEQLLQVSILPLIHLLYAHGIAMEAHAQNIVLIHKAGYPVRLALKDFHDGVRFSRNLLSEPALCPDLKATPAYHARVNRNSFIETDNAIEVRDFLHDALFFINLAEFGLFLEENYDLEEDWFWSKAIEIIRNYQARFPQLSARFEKFDLFSATIQVEQLTKRRLFPENQIRIHSVANPLFK